MPEYLIMWSNGYHDTAGETVLITVWNDQGECLMDEMYNGYLSWCALAEAIGDALGRGDEAREEHMTYCVERPPAPWGGKWRE